MPKAPGDEEWKIWEREWAAYGVALLREVPASLGVRGVLASSPGIAFWVDGFRGSSDGFVFETHYRWHPRRAPHGDPDRWPELTSYPGNPDPVGLGVSIGGHVRLNTGSGTGTLHGAGGSGLPGITEHSWWVPELPGESIEIFFNDQAADIGGDVTITTADWRRLIADGVLPIEST